MKRLLGLLGISLCSAAFGQITPGFLSGQILTAAQLNAAFAQAVNTVNGQVSGLTVTTGLTATGLVTPTDLASQAANTVLANVTGTAASPAVIALPTGCNTAASALQYTTGSFTCGTVANAGANSNITSLTGLTTPLGTWAGGLGINNSAATGVPVFSTGVATVTAVTGTGAPVLATNPTITTPIVTGVTNGSAAAAGQVGEIITATGTGVALTTGTPMNCATITLTAGDWNVWGNANFSPAGTTVQSSLLASVSTTSGTSAVPPYLGVLQLSFPAGVGQSIAAPIQIVNVASSTPVYLVVQATFTTSTEAVTCHITARRAH